MIHGSLVRIHAPLLNSNRRSSGLSGTSQSHHQFKIHNSSLSIAKAIPGFIQFKSVEGLSPRTLVGYEHDQARKQNRTFHMLRCEKYY